MDSRKAEKSARPVEASRSAPRKRFRIEKLEERIAPKKGGNGSHQSSASSGLSGGVSIY